MVTYEDIKKANETIKTTAIERKDKKGNVISKDYAEVNQRIKAFRMVYPMGRIETKMISNENGICIFNAMVWGNYEYDNGQVTQSLLGTGTAYEKEGSSFINNTSYIENCETSAVGRALGMAGFGIDTSIASAEEVHNAMANQEQSVRKATPKQLELISKIKNQEKMLNFYKVNSINELTMEQASDCIKKMKGA